MHGGVFAEPSDRVKVCLRYLNNVLQYFYKMLCQNDDSDFNVCLSAFTLGFLHLLGKNRKKSLQDTDNMWYTTNKYENVGYHADEWRDDYANRCLK